MHRKVLLRRNLLKDTPPAIAYVPFIGDGDLAVELYAGWKIYGADIFEKRVETASKRLPEAQIVEADCDKSFPFAAVEEEFSMADFDAYANPYKALVQFWKGAQKAPRLILFGTDGLRQGIARNKRPIQLPTAGVDKSQKWREQHNKWWAGYVFPFIAQTVAPYRIVREFHYLRKSMLYWGVEVSREGGIVEDEDSPITKAAAVEDALYQAAASGNVKAIELWLDLQRRPAKD
jgi:hypothetical protein